MRRAPCDTLITRPLSGTEPFSKNRILVPLDGSHLAERALGPAVALALERDMDILLLRVSPPVFIELEPLGSQYTFDGIEGMAVDINPKYSRYSFSSIEVEAKEEAKVYLQNLRAALPPLPGSVKIEVLIGTPAAAIVDYADEQEVDLIIMSSHGRTGTFLWLMGSVAEKVLRKAACPTLIVRPPKQ